MPAEVEASVPAVGKIAAFGCRIRRDLTVD
jgi:hypothetical protein